MQHTLKVNFLMKTNEKIRLLRNEHEWSQKEMAEKLQMSVNGYSKIERGESNLNMERLQQIAETLGVSLNELLPTNDGNIVFMINSDNYHSSFYNNGDTSEEIEKLKMPLQHKDELLAQQARELATLQDALHLLKQNLK